MIVSLRAQTPRAKVLVETMPYWRTDGKLVQRRMVASGDAVSHVFQFDAKPGEYMLTVTEMIRVKRFVSTPEGTKEVFTKDDGFEAPYRQNEKAGESHTHTLTILESGQYTVGEYVSPPHPDQNFAATVLDGSIAMAKGALKPKGVEVVAQTPMPVPSTT